MKLPVPARGLPPKLARKLQSALQAGLGNVSRHTERSYRRGLVDFALWLRDHDVPLEIPDPPPPRTKARLPWELEALHAAGSYLCRLSASSATLLAEAYGRDLLYGDNPVTRKTAEQRILALSWATREAKRLGQIDWKLEVRLPRPKKDAVGRLDEKPGRDMTGPTPEEAQRLMEAAAGHDDPRAYPILSLLRREGYREREIRQLDVADVDLELGTVKLVRKWQDEARTYPLSSASRLAIAKWLEHHHPTAKGPLFTGGLFGEARTRIGSTMIWRIVTRLGESVGVSTSPHRVRHRACTDIVRAGMRAGLPEEELLFLTGHSSRQALYPYYEAAKDRKAARCVLDSLDDLFEKENDP